MISKIDIIKIVCHVANRDVADVCAETKMGELCFDDYDRAKRLITHLNGEFDVEITFYMISNCVQLGDLITCVMNRISENQTLVISEKGFYAKDKEALLSILKNESGNDIVKLQLSLKDMNEKLKKFTADLKDSSAPV
ncbi:MAG: hypothetical protein ACRDCN_09245, partial [Tannerellaceae bacterium]